MGTGTAQFGFFVLKPTVYVYQINKLSLLCKRGFREQQSAGLETEQQQQGQARRPLGALRNHPIVQELSHQL